MGNAERLTGPQPDIEPSYQACRQRLMTLARSQVRDERTAEDIVHETFVRALSNGVPIGDTSLPWLCTVARNLCIDHLRRRSKGLPHDPNIDIEDIDAGATFDRVIDEVDSRRDRRAVAVAMRSIRSRDRRVLWLRDVEGWRYDDIAAMEGTTVLASRCRVSRARARLRRQVVAALARGLGVAVALRSLVRRGLEPQRVLLLGGAMSLTLGALVAISPVWDLMTPDGNGAHVVAVAKTEPDRPAAAPAGEAPADTAAEPTPHDVAPTLDLQIGHSQDRSDRAIPDGAHLRIEVRDLQGGTVLWSDTSMSCESEREGARLGDGVLVVTC